MLQPHCEELVYVLLYNGLVDRAKGQRYCYVEVGEGVLSETERTLGRALIKDPGPLQNTHGIFWDLSKTWPASEMLHHATVYLGILHLSWAIYKSRSSYEYQT